MAARESRLGIVEAKRSTTYEVVIAEDTIDGLPITEGAGCGKLDL